MSLPRSRRPQGPSIKKHRCWTFLVGGVKRKDEPKKNGGIDATRGETSSLDTVSDNGCDKGDVNVTEPNEVDAITHCGLALPSWHRFGIEVLATRESKSDRPVMALSQPSVGRTEAMDGTSSVLTLGLESFRQLDDVWSCFETPPASPRDCVNQTTTMDGSAFDLLTITDDEKDDCGLAWCRSLTSSGSYDYDPSSDASELLRTAWLLDSSCVSEDNNIYGECWTQNPFTVGENTTNPVDSGQVAGMDNSGVDSQDDSDLDRKERYLEVELIHKVCDFEGRPSLDGGSCAPMATEPPHGGQSYLLLKGITTADQGGCEMPSMSAFFSAGHSHKAGRMISPVKVVEDGVIQAAVFYPSMQVLWPDVYVAKNIQEVEVDVAIDLRWGNEETNCAGPSLKVTYRRPPVQATNEAAASMIACRRTSPTSNDVVAEGGTMRDDY